ncbi:hypothetical protein [Chlorobium sp. KB01]|uniref:hypothetical protein n=1 Tax=Chlorobium sp. KB01 TaxID=1917528 RepID=UPI0009779E0E|nr:hypothetical protein [Chlorobium sp. KB01]
MMNYAKKKGCSGFLGTMMRALIPVVFFTVGVAPADSLAKPDSLSVKYGADFGVSTMSMTNTHFGLGQLDVEYYAKDIARTEAYVAPKVEFILKDCSLSSFYGGLRAVGSYTRGDGDSWGLTAGERYSVSKAPQLVGENLSHLDIDKAYIGWRSGETIPFVDRDGIDISIGKQNFMLGDGMVLVDGNDEANAHKGIYWLDPRQAWENTGILRVRKMPYYAELFYLMTDHDAGDDEILGGNIELQDSKHGKIGLSYFNVLKSAMDTRDGTSTVGLHGRGHPLNDLPNMEIAGEFDYQRNTFPSKTARAWFSEVKYYIPELPWYPTIGYRYSSFSGDDASTGSNEAWDYMHNGSTPYGFGYWYQGIVVGTYETRLSNLDTHFFNITLMPPLKDSWLKIFYYDYHFNKASTAKLDDTAVSSKRFASEWDLILGYSPSGKVDYMLIYGNATPHKGGVERVFGNDKHADILQFTVLMRF